MAREPVTGLIERFRARRAEQEARNQAVVEDELERHHRLRERVSQQITAQWELAREARKAEQPQIAAGPSNFTRAQVPWGLDVAAAWAWRVVIIAVAALMLLWTLRFFSVVVLPLLVALLVAALVAPLVTRLSRVIPRKLAALLVVLLGLATISLLLVFVGQQVSQGIGDLSGKVVEGLDEIREWLRDGPLNASDSQINDLIEQSQEFISSNTEEWLKRVGEFSVAIGHIVAGIFIVLFATYFFLADGALIWAWLVRIFPRAARLQADASGRVAWESLTQFVRATVLVAAVDAIGIMIIAVILKVPLVGAIGVLVFLGSFVPMIGAFLSGTVAVLVALVDQGPIVALLMLGGVVLVQQVEAHVLQPFLMGRFVSVHPLGVIIAIAAGVIVAGIAGALIAVPLVAALNAVVQYLAGNTIVGEETAHAIERDPEKPEGEAVAASLEEAEE